MGEEIKVANELTPSELARARDAILLAMVADNNFRETERVAREVYADPTLTAEERRQFIEDEFREDLRRTRGLNPDGTERGGGPNIKLTTEEINHIVENYE